MSLPIPTLSSSSLLTLKSANFKFCPLQSRITLPNFNQKLRFQSSSSKIQPLFPKFSDALYGFSRRRLGFCVRATENGSGEKESKVGVVDSDAVRSRGESTVPARFRHLAKEAPDPPIRWPFFIAIPFLLYAWRAVLFELSNWKKVAIAITHFVGYILKLVLALIFHFIGDPLTLLIRCIETTLYTIRAYYSSIVAYAPIPELTVIIIMASSILAIAESTAPNSTSNQPYLLTLSGIVGYAAVRGVISELFFWTILIGIYGFSRFLKKRDDISAVLPVAAILAAVGEPWVRFVVVVSYLALAISHNWKRRGDEDEVLTTGMNIPMPLLGAAVAIGIRVAAKWAGYRHLTWMIV